LITRPRTVAWTTAMEMPASASDRPIIPFDQPYWAIAKKDQVAG
jgi:hypothetical protein